MNVVLLRMAHFTDGPIVWHETGLPNITKLKSLSNTIQKIFNLGGEGAVEYEVLGRRAPGCRARLRDLIVSEITHFRYVQHGVRKQCVQIDIFLLPPTPAGRPTLAARNDRTEQSARKMFPVDSALTKNRSDTTRNPRDARQTLSEAENDLHAQKLGR